MQMFPRLRHDPFIGGNNQNHEIDTGRSGHHVPDKPLVAGNIDNPEGPAVRKAQGGKSEFDRNPPLFFLPETVGVHAGESFDQSRFAVVHMAGRSHHKMLHSLRNSRLTRFSQQQI